MEEKKKRKLEAKKLAIVVENSKGEDESDENDSIGHLGTEEVLNFDRDEE